jgi:putative transposase
VWRLCRDQRLWSTTTKQGRKSSGKRPGRRRMTISSSRFHRESPERGVGHRHHRALSGEGKLYACLIQDLFSKRIVGYAIGDRMTRELSVRTLRNAVARRRRVGTTIVHSDRGSQVRQRSWRC